MPTSSLIMTAADVKAELSRLSEPERVPKLLRYFRCEPGGYGEGDAFRGVRVPNVRKVAQGAGALSSSCITELMESRFHEDRLLGAILLVHRYERAESAEEKYRVRSMYLQLRKGIDNWDLVDASAPGVVGAWTLRHGSAMLHTLAASPSLWDRRIAMVATLHHIRTGDVDSAIEIAHVLAADRRDLIQKATGWMLREAWKREPHRVESFLMENRSRLSSTTRQYATERMNPDRREQVKQGEP